MTEKGEPDSRHAVSGESARGEVWPMNLFHRILRWSGLPGWEARVVRNNFVYQERLRDAFEAFDQGDYTAAFTLFKREADAGSAVAQHNTGILYEAGYGIPRSDEAAERYYLQAAEQGFPEAQYQLGAILAADFLLRNAQIPAKDEFAHIFTAALLSEKGRAMLVQAAERGKGEISQREWTGIRETVLDDAGLAAEIPDRMAEGYKWLYIAKLRGMRDAKPALRRLRKAMSRDAVNEAEAAALSWQAEHMHLGRIQTRTGPKSRVREGFRRLAIVLGATGALIVVAIMLITKGDAPLLSNWLWLTALATVGAFVALWLPMRVIGWIVAGFFEDKPS